MSSSTESELAGAAVNLTPSDPWELVREMGSGPFAATVLRVGADSEVPGRRALLIAFDPPVRRGDVEWRYAIASPRSDADDVTSLARGRPIHCGLTRIPPDRALSDDPFDLSWWRGGDALVGTLEPAGPGRGREGS
jgi:hypothetical protein